MLDGRDFDDRDAYPGVAIVNEAFAKRYFGGENPIGRSFEETPSRGNALPQEAEGRKYRVRIVGLVADAQYAAVREPAPPTVYVPFKSVDRNGALERLGWGTFIVRTTAGDPVALAPVFRREVPRARSEFRVSTVRTQAALHRSQTVRERLLATLALFFAVLAVLLAGVGLAGVLHYSVVQRRREIGVRMALGSRSFDVVRHVTSDALMAVAAGLTIGLGMGLACGSYVQALLYQVEVADPAMLVFPSVTLAAVAVLAALPAAIEAVRIDPLQMLRVD